MYFTFLPRVGAIGYYPILRNHKHSRIIKITFFKTFFYLNGQKIMPSESENKVKRSDKIRLVLE